MKDWELSYRNNGRYLKSDQKKKKKEKNQSDAATLSFEEWSQKKKETAAAKPSFEEWSNTKKKFAEAFAPIAVKGAYTKNEADDVNVGMADGDYSESKETGGKSKTTVTRTGKKKTTTTENKVTHRDANLMDITLRSLKRGYYNARYGEESYAAMFGQDNKKAAYEEILNGDEYKFVPSNKLEEGVAGAFELLGQQARQFSNPTSVTAGTAAAGGAFVAGQLGPQIGIPEEVITVPGAFVMGLSAGSAASSLEIEAGLAYNEMIEAGITEDTARKVALGVGSVNAGLELLQIDELLDAYKVVSKGATKGVGKKIAKELADRGVSVVTETAQEVAQEGVTIAGTQVASKIETGDWAYSADDVKDRLVDTAKSSALSFGIMNVPAAVRNSASYATEQKNAKKLTSNEEKVVEKEVENRVAEEETNGKKLSNKVKNKIYDAVIKDLEKGNISTDTIEEVLGGETYTSYREAVDREDALQKEFDTLNKMKQGDMTGEQVDRREELRQQLKDIQENAQRDQLKTRLGEEVSEMVRGERLSESYNEKARRSQAFVADVTQYDAKQQETVQKAIDSGVLNNTNRTHEFVDMIAKISAEKGVSFDFTDNAKLKETGFALEGKTVNGYVTDSGITINVNSAKAFNSVVGHEITHVLEGTELYDTLQQTLFEYAKSKGDYQSRLDALTALYKDVEGTDINAELTADLVGDYLFTDTDFVMKLSTEHRNIFQKIFDEIKYLCKVATAGSKEARQLEKVRKVFEEAYRESGKAQKNTATEGSVRYALSNQNGYDYSQSFEQQIDDYKAGKIPSRDTLLVGATPEVYQSIGLNALPMTINTTHVDYALNGTKDADHYLGEAVLKQLPESIKDPVAVFVSRTKSGSSVVALLNFNVNGKRVVAPVEIDGFGFQNGIRIDSNAVTSIYGKNSALKQLYQAAQNESNGIFSLLYANKKEAYSLLQSAGYQLSGGLIPHDGFYHSIRENNSPVKPKFNNVAESQQFKRWFGDWQKHPKNASKVVDSDGNPLVVYHGTDAEFTEFNTDNQRTNSKLNFGKGIYLTPNKNLAEMYTTTGNVMELYASVKNPYEIFSTRLDESDLQKLSAEFGENVTLENIDAVLQKNKFDGIIARNYNGTTNPINQIVVFNSNQVKSATDNIGTFDGNNPDIRYSLSSGNENTAPVKGGIYGKDILLAPIGENVVRTQRVAQKNIAPVREDIASGDDENSTIKMQLRDSQEILKGMDPVAEIQAPEEFSHMDKTSKQNWVIEKLRSTNYEVDRKGFGIISFAKKRLKSAFNYFAKGGAEESAFEALPYVLENGIEISNRNQHKGRGYGTVTIAAPITINGKRGNMAVVVKKTDGNYYKVHRILTPDGSVFNLSDITKETESTPAGELPQNGSLATPIDSVSNNSISKIAPVVKENIAPVREDIKSQTASPDNLAPIGKNVERTGVAKDAAPATKKKETDKDAEQEKIAEILTEEPTPANRKSRIWAKFMANFVDKGAAFEDLSLKTKNRELMGKWNYMLHSEARAQQLIGNGADNVKSLNAIREEVDGTGLTKQFYDYLYHKHNVDRMSLENDEIRAKITELQQQFSNLNDSQIEVVAREWIQKDTPKETAIKIRDARELLKLKRIKNKPVFGDSVTADVSKEVAEQYESEHPEFQQYAQDVYDYMNHLRQLMVDNGVISQETADLWSEMYPHYVPIRRTGDTGLNINVPLDTGRTGVNAPVKGATGGNSDILPLFDTMGQRTIQTFKAIDKNSFGLELKDTLGTAIASEAASVDDAIDSIDMQEGLLQEGKNGGNPTFTVFENGERVTFEISEDMYDALKPVSEGLASTNKALNTINNIRRGLLTEYNPTFMLTNAIKDAQDVLLNSQHPMKTYAKLPEAYAQLFRKGYWYKEYVENGGEQNTYFDNKTYTFTTENKGLAKLLNMPPLSTISKVNSFIEMAPRLAEYIASREAGRSVEVSMLDAARVTTNFAAGGDVTKFLNRNGATFLNASVQGAMQQVRNVREAKANGLKGWVNLAAKFIAAGLPALLLNGLIWDDDEEYQELSDYVKQSYYIIGKYDDGKFVRIPKGRTVAVIQNAFELVSDSLTGDDEVDLSRFLELGALAVSNIAPNNPIDNNILAPIFQAVSNETWYGEDLVPSRLQDLPATEQFDESTDAVSKWLGEKLNISPVKINYLLDQYSGGLGDMVLPMMTPQAESGDNSFIGNMLAPLKDKFTADSVMNNQNVSDFYDTVDMLATGAKKSNATDEDVLKYKYINSINADLSDLYKQKREIQNSDLANDEKYEQIRELQQQIDDVAKEGLSTYGDVTISGSYAAVGDRHYKLNDDGEWQKLNDKQVEKMEIFSKVVGGNAAYISHFGDLNAIKSDKDESGETISGSRKDKVIEYINNLDADYGEKIILFRSQYTGDDTYNYEIIDYLNSRDDISYEEMETILKELGFTVLSDGTVKW